MLLLILSFLGGALTIVSPCILPVLPFVFARTGQPFRRSALPMLAGMALTFALVATLAAVGGGWVVQANQYGRWLAMALMAFFALTLLMPHLADRLARPLVAAGDRLSRSARESSVSGGAVGSPGSSFLLGIATGLLWAPCAGPVLGLVLTGAALNGASVGTTLLLLAYAAGAATSLGLALLVGGKVLATMKRSLGTGQWIRKIMGAAMLCGVAAIAMGLDTGLLTRVSSASTASLEQGLINRLSPEAGKPATQGAARKPSVDRLPVEGMLPALTGANQWINSPALNPENLKGKVVLIDFWTYSCINCLRSLPYTIAWDRKYRDQGLVVIGVHTPEFAFERDVGNVRTAMEKLGIRFPVAIDNDFAIWRAMNNEYWPAHFFIDAKGQVRAHHFGEGDYVRSEQIIQQLLKEAGHDNVASDIVQPATAGAQMPARTSDIASHETYLGYARAADLASPGGQQRDQARAYELPARLTLNQWALTGNWTARAEHVDLQDTPGRIVYRFKSRDLHLVMGAGKQGKPVRFRVSIDGSAPGDSHGSDIAADGSGTVSEQRLYQLIRQPGTVQEREFSIEFLDPGVQVFAFTFG